MNYDPNLVMGWADQVVRLTLGMWSYRGTFDVTVRGNCCGLPSILQTAQEALYEHLAEGRETALVRLYEGSESLIVEDEEDEGYDFLAQLVVGAVILSIAQEAKGPIPVPRRVDAAAAGAPA